MKKWLKILCLVLVVAFILPALVACDNEDDKKGDGKTDGVILEKPGKLDGTTYNNSTFTIYSLGDMFNKKYFFADKSSGKGMDEVLYQRQQTIEKLLEVDLIYKEVEGVGGVPAHEVYGGEVQSAIKSGTEKYQLVGTHTYYSIPDLIIGNSLKDFKEFETIDLNKSYWNKGIMEQVSYKGHYYLGYSDYNLAATYVVAFNKTLYNEFESAFNGNTMYDYVNNGEWTLTKMSEVASYVYKDEGGGDKNTYGLTGELWVPFCGFIQSSGESIVKKNEQSNKYELTWNDNTTIKNKLNKLVKELSNIKNMKETYFWVNSHPSFAAFGDATPIKLSNGKVFMELVNTNELIELTTVQLQFGVVPYPMYDKDQYNTVKYQSLNWAGYLAVPANVSNTKMVSDVLECMAFYSSDVTTYYYEKLLGRKVSESPDDAKMLDIVWDSLCSDFGVAYGMIDNKGNLDAFVYSVPRCLMEKSTFGVFHAKYSRGAKTAIDDKLNK